MKVDLNQLEALADELLLKSEETEELKAKDIVEDSPDIPEDDDKEKDDIMQKSEDSLPPDLEKCDDPDMKKSDDPANPDMEEHRDEEDQDADDLEKAVETNPPKGKPGAPKAKDENLETEKINGDREEKDAEGKPDDLQTSKETLKKSLMEQMINHPQMAGMVPNNFMNAVIDVLSKSLADMRHEIMESRTVDDGSNDILAKSSHAGLVLSKSLATKLDDLESDTANLRKSMKSGFEKVLEAIEELSTQPVGIQKSVKNIKTMDRDFARSTAIADTSEELSKSQVVDLLTGEFLAGNPLIKSDDVVKFEAGGSIRPEVMSFIRSKIR